ncbi:MAG: hypothetical protein DRP50_04360, partial [Thermotoga sp.]
MPAFCNLQDNPYTQEFKKEAVEYSLTSGKTVEEVAHDLGISYHNL